MGAACLLGHGLDAGEHDDRRFVEPEALHRAHDLAALDEEDVVAGEPGRGQGLRIERADVEEARRGDAVQPWRYSEGALPGRSSCRELTTGTVGSLARVARDLAAADWLAADRPPAQRGAY